MDWYETIKRRLQTELFTPATAHVYVMFHFNRGVLTKEQAVELLDMPLSGIPSNSPGGSC